MTPSQKRDEWLRYYAACSTPESRLGALRGAMRDNVLPEVLKAMKLTKSDDLIQSLHAEAKE